MTRSAGATNPTEAGWALVTGASSGIGDAFARALVARGHRVILVARRADRLRDLASQLGGDHRAIPLPIDLATPGIGMVLQGEVERLGLEVNLLVNNAGLGHTGVFHVEPLDKAISMIDVNLRAVVEISHAFLPAMVKRRSGALINVVSTSAFQPVPYLSIYAASKAFVLSFTEALALELAGTGVRVQALCPGLTATEFQQVAHTDRVLFNRTGSMTPAAVVECSLRALERGTLTVVPGLANRSVIAAQSWLPRSLVRRVAGALFRPPEP